MADKNSYGAATGSEELYVIEARTSYHEPENINGFILTNEWRRLPVYRSPIGVKECVFHPIKETGLLNYEAAIALAMEFIASPNQMTRGHFCQLCLEARLVKVRLTYDWKTEEVGVGEPITMRNLRQAEKFTVRP